MSPLVVAAPISIKLWPQGIPGAIDGHGIQEYEKVSRDSLHVWDVTDPEILVYLPPEEKRNGSAVLVIPGGGYGVIALEHEGFVTQRWLSELGFTVAILKYRLPNPEIMKDRSIGPLQDAQQAMRIIRRNAAEWGVNTDRVGVIGFSAGGHLAASLSTHFDLATTLGAPPGVSARPDFSILVYPVISMGSEYGHGGSRGNLLGEQPDEALVKLFSLEHQITQGTPPTFILHAIDDQVVPYRNSLAYTEAMIRQEIPVELHLYPSGGHGFALGQTGTSTTSWPTACETWLRANNFAPGNP